MSTRATTFQPSKPTETSLREAALRHLARYAATTAGLTRVLDRRIDRWLRAAPDAGILQTDAAAARQAVRRVVAKLVETGVLNDTAYAEGRARALLRAGKSRRGVQAHLAQRGIDRTTLRAALPEDTGQELAAALLLVRRRKLSASDLPTRRRALGILARAGFSQHTAREALSTPADEAEDHIVRLKLGA